MSEATADSSTACKWSNYFNKKAWIKSASTKWPSYIYDPNSLPNYITHELRQKAVNLINKKLFIKYFGMPEQSAYGYVAFKDVTLYTDDDDSLYNQKLPKSCTQQFKEGLLMMRQSSGWDTFETSNDQVSICLNFVLHQISILFIKIHGMTR